MRQETVLIKPNYFREHILPSVEIDLLKIVKYFNLIKESSFTIIVLEYLLK